jgi:carbohydrate diacid regulator
MARVAPLGNLRSSDHMGLKSVSAATLFDSALEDQQHLATEIVCRTAELVAGPVALLDAAGMVVASSDPAIVGKLAGDTTRAWRAPLQVPIEIGGLVGSLLVGSNEQDAAPVPARIIHSLVDHVLEHLVNAPRPLDEHTELKNRLIYSLLREEPRHPRQALRDARLLGMDLTPPRAVILIDANDAAVAAAPAWGFHVGECARRVVDIVMGFFELPDDTICAWDERGEVAVLKASDSNNLRSWISDEDDRDSPGPSWANLTALRRAAEALLERLRADGAAADIGIGRYHPGVEGLARSYADARAALSLGKRFLGEHRVHSLDGLGIAAFVGLADEETKLSLARHLLSPLDHEETLLNTLSTFFAVDCSASAAARRLGIHRNTLTYRLDKIKTLTGLDPNRFDEAVQMRVALVVRSLADGRSLTLAPAPEPNGVDDTRSPQAD